MASDKILAKFEVELEHAILDTADHGMDSRYDNDIWRETNDKSEISIADIKHVRQIRENDISIKNDISVTGQHKSKNVGDNNEDGVDTAIKRCKKKNESRDSNKAVKYDELEIDVLADYVRKFLIQHGGTARGS